MKKLIILALLPLLLAACEQNYNALPDGTYEITVEITALSPGECPYYIIRSDKPIISDIDGKEYTELYSEEIPSELHKDGQKIRLHFRFTGETYQCGFGMPYQLIDIISSRAL